MAGTETQPANPEPGPAAEPRPDGGNHEPGGDLLAQAEPPGDHEHSIGPSGEQPPPPPGWQPNPSLVIQAHQLTKSYPGKHRGAKPRTIVRNVNINVGPGRVHVLMGLSGAGKSTVVGMIAGLLIPSQGTVYHHGEPVDHDALRRLVAVSIGSDTGFYGKLPVLDNLVFFGALLGYDRKDALTRARDVLDMVGLGGAAGTAWGALSSGQRRQGHLARALLTKRPLLIADEPTRGLDPATEQRVVDLLVAIKKARQSMLVVTHDVHLAASLADWVSIMEGGVVVRSGSPADLLHILGATRIYIKFGSDPTRIIERLRQLPNLTDIHTHDHEVHVYTRAPEEDINDIIRLLASEGMRISHIDLPAPGLEEVFMKIVAERKHHQQLAARAPGAAKHPESRMPHIHIGLPRHGHGRDSG